MTLVADAVYPLRKTMAHVVGVPDDNVLIQAGSSSNGIMRPGSSIPMQDFGFKYYILEPEGKSDDAIITALKASAAIEYGGKQDFIYKLENQLGRHEATTGIEVRNGWRVSIDIFSAAAEVVEVSAGSGHAGSTPRPATTTRDPAAAAQAGSDCTSHGVACSCAAVPECTWGENYYGVPGCAVGVGGVTCEDCPAQVDCPNAGCSVVSEPCSCLSSSFVCRWEVLYSRCVSRQGGSTPCTACARQSQCDPPIVVGFFPDSGTLLKLPDHLQIRVRFDRQIRMISGKRISFSCTAPLGPQYVPENDIDVDDTSLWVSVESLLDTSSSGYQLDRECQMIIDEGLVTDNARVPFLGLYGSDAYRFRLGDTVSPHVAQTVPVNGITVAGVTKLEFIFNEAILLGPGTGGQYAVLTSLESLVDATSSNFALTGPQVEVSQNKMNVDISSEVLRQGILYSLALPRAAVVDLAGNAFEGLPIRTYAFRVGASAGTDHSQSSELMMPQVAGMAAAVASGLVAVAGIIYLMRRWMMRQVRRSDIRYSTSKVSSVRPTQGPQPPRKQATSPPSNPPQDGPGLRRASPSSWSGPDLSESEDPDSGQWGSGTWEDSLNWPGGHASRSPGVSGVRAEVLPGQKNSAWAQRPQAHQRWQKAGTKAQATGSFAAAAQAARRASSGDAGVGAAQANAAAGRRASTGSPQAGSPQAGADAPMGSASSVPTRNGRGSGAHKAGAAGAVPAAAAPKRSASKPERTDASGKDSAKGGDRRSRSQGPESGGSKKMPTPPPASDLSGPDSETKRRKLEIERKLRDAMSKPVAERKKLLRELMLEYHPDKNSEEYAKEVFQFINTSRGWFLAES